MENKKIDFNAIRNSDNLPVSNVLKPSMSSEYVMVMHLDDDIKVRVKTGTLNYSTAKESAFEGILYVEKKFGPIRFWNWEGEDTVLRTVESAFPVKSEQPGLLGKLSNFINADNSTEVEHIRRRNNRKEKLLSFKAKIDSFFEMDDDFEDCYETPLSDSKKTWKEKVISIFYKDVEDKK